jgi:hypothetical protein
MRNEVDVLVMQKTTELKRRTRRLTLKAVSASCTQFVEGRQLPDLWDQFTQGNGSCQEGP